MVRVEQTNVSISVVAAYQRNSPRGQGPANAMGRVSGHATAYGLRGGQTLELRVQVTVQTVRALLLSQTGREPPDLVEAPNPESGEPLLPDYLQPEAVTSRILDFVRSASGGDADRLERLMEAVETAFAEVETILGGEVPEVSLRTMEMVREGLRIMLEEFRAAQGGSPDGAVVELSTESKQLAKGLQGPAEGGNGRFEA